MNLPWVTSRYGRGGLFAAGPAAPAVASGPFNVETIATTSNLAARTGDAQGFLAFDKTTGQLYVAFGSNLWTKHGAD